MGTVRALVVVVATVSCQAESPPELSKTEGASIACNVSGSGQLVFATQLDGWLRFDSTQVSYDEYSLYYTHHLSSTNLTNVRCGYADPVTGRPEILFEGIATWDAQPDHQFVLTIEYVATSRLATASLTVTAPDGTIVREFVDQPFASGQLDAPPLDLAAGCTITIRNATLAGGALLDAYVSATTRYVTYQAPPDKAKPLRMVGRVDWMVCRVDGVILGDFGGAATVYGRENSQFLVSVQDLGATDYLHVAIGNDAGEAFHEIEGYTSSDTVSVVP